MAHRDAGEGHFHLVRRGEGNLLHVLEPGVQAALEAFDQGAVAMEVLAAKVLELLPKLGMHVGDHLAVVPFESDHGVHASADGLELGLFRVGPLDEGVDGNVYFLWEWKHVRTRAGGWRGKGLLSGGRADCGSSCARARFAAARRAPAAEEESG